MLIPSSLLNHEQGWEILQKGLQLKFYARKHKILKD